jgi:NTF2 fold immunity protein
VHSRAAKFVVLGLLAFSSAFAQETSPPHNYKPPEGYVPDAQTAIQIALAVWLPIYGRKQIDSEKPYTATLKDGVWTVSGTLPHGYNVGGVAVAEISKLDGTILRVSHGM